MFRSGEWQKKICFMPLLWERDWRETGKQEDQAGGFSGVLELRWWRRKEWELGGLVTQTRLSLFRIS